MNMKATLLLDHLGKVAKIAEQSGVTITLRPDGFHLETTWCEGRRVRQSTRSVTFEKITSVMPQVFKLMIEKMPRRRARQ
jgi:hypothetical protein